VPKRLTLLLAFAGILLAVALPQAAYAQSPTAPGATKAVATATPLAKHAITVKFDYDFGRSPVCSAKITTKCVQQFNVYDISGGTVHRIKLFSVPVPTNASGQVKGITGTSPQLSWEPGTHFLAVSAQATAGNESDPAVCTTTVQINP
jgi:hypothetical protein